MNKKNELVIFETTDHEITLEVPVEGETVWLTQAQMTHLFETTKQNISLHINNCFRENELDKESVVKDFLTTAQDGKNYRTKYYNLDVIISVGYRVKSKRGVESRKWANTILKQYILQGYAVNHNRIAQLGEVIQIMKRTENALDAKQVLNVIQKYSEALELLDSYDHQTMVRPK
ncbi:MAG: virulence RhuM family protein, partial [Firmicutes bacterium]|nr:virulence RhuM family protein [Bacillota bacterium]